MNGLEEWERLALRNALACCKGSRADAAKMLRVTKYTIYRLVKKHGYEDAIDPDFIEWCEKHPEKPEI